MASVALYEPDRAMEELLAPYDERAKSHARELVGELVGGPLSPEDEIPGIPAALLQDTALVDLFSRVQLHYADADVSVSSVTQLDSNIQVGPIRRCDISQMYKFNNTLYKLRMTGKQLRKFLEWSAGMYRQWRPGDLTLAFEEGTRPYMLVALTGMTYQIDVSKEDGKRVVGLSWPDGRALADDESFIAAVNNYDATTYLLSHGLVFDEGEELPEMLGADLRGDIGGIRELIADYVQNVCGGVLRPEVDGNWRLVGNDWDSALHEKAVEAVRSGKIVLDENDGSSRELCAKVVTEADLEAI